MYTFVGFLQILVYLAILIVIGFYLYGKYQEKQQAYAEDAPIRKHLATKDALGRAGNIEEGAPQDPHEAARQNLSFLGLPSVKAGGHILNVPAFNALQEGRWDSNQAVVTTARANVLTKQGPVPMDLSELTEGYFIAASGANKLLLQKHDLTTLEADRLESERQEAVDRQEPAIENFLGHTWKIIGAFGEHRTSSGEKQFSKIRVLSHLRSDSEFKSCLPPNLFDGEEHDYYDVRARNENGDILYGFYAGGEWVCLIGRKMTDPEVNQLQAA